LIPVVEYLGLLSTLSGVGLIGWRCVAVHGGLPPGETMTEEGAIPPADTTSTETVEDLKVKIEVLYEAFQGTQQDLDDALATIEVLEKEIIEAAVEKDSLQSLLDEKDNRVRELELRAAMSSKTVERLEPELEKMEEKYTREKDRLGKVYSIAEELDNDLHLAVKEMKARDDWYVDHMKIFEDLNQAIKVRYEMIESAIEAERKSQHMARAFTERIEEMVESRAAEMTIEEAESINSSESAESPEVVEETTAEEATPASEESTEESTEEVTEKATEEVVEEKASSGTTAAATWADGEDPWATD
tara:strand:+ start:10813 stop:11721 length:909 start_codon:yes stop_codon:yes gene_type:complete